MEAWQLRRQDLIPFASTYPISTASIPSPISYSEAALHAHSLVVRRTETTPPIVPRFPVGSWAIDTLGELHQLREYALDDPRLHFPEGDPYGRFRPWLPRQRWVIEKYISWLLAGHEPPPLTGIEMENWRIKIAEGHHRAEALVEVGRRTCQIWVAVLFIQPENGFGRGLTHELAVQAALREGKPVPHEVLTDYPRFIRKGHIYLWP